MTNMRALASVLIVHGKIHNLMAFLGNWEVADTADTFLWTIVCYGLFFCSASCLPRGTMRSASSHVLCCDLVSQHRTHGASRLWSLWSLHHNNSSSFSCLSDILHSHNGTNRNTKVHQSFKSRSSPNPVIKMLRRLENNFYPSCQHETRTEKKVLNPVPYTKHGEASNTGTAH